MGQNTEGIVLPGMAHSTTSYDAENDEEDNEEGSSRKKKKKVASRKGKEKTCRGVGHAWQYDPFGFFVASLALLP